MPHYRFIPPAPPVTPTPVIPPTTPAILPVSHRGPKFITGIFAQPYYNMPGLKILGFNTLVSVPMNHDPLQWAIEATRLKLFQIRPAVDVKALDKDNPYWIMWENPDEPDRMTPDRVTPTNPPITQALIDENYAKAIAAGVPTFTNFDASRVLGVQPPVFGAGASYASILAKTDYACCDLHPVAGWGVLPGKPNGAIDMYAPGYASDVLRELKGDPDNSKLLMYMETTQEVAKFRGPTVAETQIYQRQIDRRKMRGYIAFTFNFEGAMEWGTPPGKPNKFCAMDAEMRENIATYNGSHL